MKKAKRKILSILSAAAMLLTMLPAMSLTASAANLPINEANFPDSVFRDYISRNIDLNADKFLSASEIAAAETIDVSYDTTTGTVENLTGVKYFTSLKQLACTGGMLTELDLEGCSKLEMLNCGYNMIESLNVNGCVSLDSLTCSYNYIQALDVSDCTKLTTFICNNNELTGVDLTTCPLLETLICDSNKLIRLDVGQNTALNFLNCFDNRLQKLDLSNNKALIEVNCYDNSLSELTLCKGGELYAVDCRNNQLTELDADGIPNLEQLFCGNNKLAAFEVDHWLQAFNFNIQYPDMVLQNVGGKWAVDIKTLVGGKENLEKVAFEADWHYDSGLGLAVFDGVGKPAAMSYRYNGMMDVICTPGEEIAIDRTNFPDDKFRALVSEEFDLDFSGALSKAEALAVQEIVAGNKGITDLTGVEHFIKLIYLHCGLNALTELDLSKNTELIMLDCSGNALTKLNVSDCANLTTLYCYDNNLTSLDLTDNPQLIEVACQRNELTELKLPAQMTDVYLNFEDNRFTTLDFDTDFGDNSYICSGNQRATQELIKINGKWAMNFGGLIGMANIGKVEIIADSETPNEWDYDPETGYMLYVGSGTPDALSYFYRGRDIPDDMMVTLTLIAPAPDNKTVIMKKDAVKAYVNGRISSTTDYGNGIFAKALSKPGGYVLPLRYIGEQFGMTVEYLGSGRTKVTNAAGEYVIVAKNSAQMEKYSADGKLIESFSASAAVFTEDSVTYVPLRAVSEALGLGVCYVGSSTTGHGSYVAISADNTIDSKLDAVKALIEEAYGAGL